MKLTLNILLLCSLFLMNTKGNCQTISEIGQNPTTTDNRCTYGFTGTIIRFDKWFLPDANNAVPINPYDAPDYSQINNRILPLVWKNVEASAYPESSILKVQYLGTDNAIHYATKSCGPFTLTFKPITFVGGSSKNIPCTSTSAITIALNSYVNTTDNGYDKGEWITHHFEWILPLGWQTTTGQTGTFVSSSSINVIPPASTAPVSISVKAKANTQYSSAATLQITRNLEDFTISGPTNVYQSTKFRYTVPSVPDVNYTWQLPSGWTGQSTGSYIDVVAGCTTGSISCTMTACNASKTITLPITSNVINPGTTISGPSLVCSSGNNFNITNPPQVNSIVWTSGPGLTITSGQNTESCTFSGTGNAISWVRATLVTNCVSITLPQKDVWAGAPVISEISGPTTTPNNQWASYNAVLENSLSAPTAYNWILNPLNGNSVYNNGSSVDIAFYNSGSYQLVVQAKNACTGAGYGPYFVTGLYVYDVLGLAVSPNPAMGEVTIRLVGENKDAPVAFTEWDCEIYDPMQIMKEKKTKLKTIETKINTAGWKEGVYIVRAKVGDKILSEKLVVKH